MSSTHPLFVYGSLKRGCSNHGRLGGQTFLAEAVTEPHFALYAVGGFPGMVRASEDGCAVRGELWEMDAAALSRLDDFEASGSLFQRELIPVSTDDGHRHAAWAYLYLGEVAGRRQVGPVWGDIGSELQQ